MRNTFVPQLGHVPSVAGRPFFSLTSLAPLIVLFALHLKQYASMWLLDLPLVYLDHTLDLVTCQYQV